MISQTQKQWILDLPKADIGVYFEGGIPWNVAIKLSKRNHGRLPYNTREDMRSWIKRQKCIKDIQYLLLAPVCQREQDYFDIIECIGRQACIANIRYKELHINFSQEQARGIPLRVIIDGITSGRSALERKSDIKIAFFAHVHAPESPDQMMSSLLKLKEFAGQIDGLSFSGLQHWQTFADFVPCFNYAKEAGMYCSFNAATMNKIDLWNVMSRLKVQRLEAIRLEETDEDFFSYLNDKNVHCAISLPECINEITSNMLKQITDSGICWTVWSPMPEYEESILKEYAKLIDYCDFEKNQIAKVAYNSLLFQKNHKDTISSFDEYYLSMINRNIDSDDSIRQGK